ncbi:hypothetical protein JTB14_022718 [Gonioctena quinquepunctata]|nr:hypothetical protein JTB14_022718 [Gonioctena quinquepunctata]
MEWNETLNTFFIYNVSQSSTEGGNITAKRAGSGGNVPPWYEAGRIQIPLYTVIFMLAVIGNTLVILTL